MLNYWFIQYDMLQNWAPCHLTKQNFALASP